MSWQPSFNFQANNRAYVQGLFNIQPVSKMCGYSGLQFQALIF